MAITYNWGYYQYDAMCYVRGEQLKKAMAEAGVWILIGGGSNLEYSTVGLAGPL